jgi:hypothetical protein
MGAHLTFKEHHNRCMKKVRAAEAQFQSLAGAPGVIPACLREVQVACAQAIVLYGSKLWWDLNEGSWRDVLQLLLN